MNMNMYSVSWHLTMWQPWPWEQRIAGSSNSLSLFLYPSISLYIYICNIFLYTALRSISWAMVQWTLHELTLDKHMGQVMTQLGKGANHPLTHYPYTN
jgi:hypothetical protein